MGDPNPTVVTATVTVIVWTTRRVVARDLPVRFTIGDNPDLPDDWWATEIPDPHHGRRLPDGLDPHLPLRVVFDDGRTLRTRWDPHQRRLVGTHPAGFWTDATR